MSRDDAHKAFLPKLSAYVDGELPSDERDAVEKHLAVNKDSAGQVADFRAAQGLVRLSLEMAADEVDFKDFATDILAKVTPHRLPLSERLSLWFNETWAYQRQLFLAPVGVAAVLMLVGFGVIQFRSPLGYANEQMRVEKVTVEKGAQVVPVVMETDDGDAIIFTGEPTASDAAVKSNDSNLKNNAQEEQETEPREGQPKENSL